MWPPQSVNTWLTPASLSVRATSSPPVILAEGATPSESPRRSLQTRLAARAAEPPRPPLGSHNRDFQTRLTAPVAEPQLPPLGTHCHSQQPPPFDVIAVEAPGNQNATDLIHRRPPPRDPGDEPAYPGPQ